ncbi:ATP-dependent RNA helicase dbp7 [Tulasnella sp. 403]|nr:ATP-dependent RNA helicase dbp7 [Tulasnella sp. 403]
MDTDGLILNIDLDYSGPQKSTTESRRSTFRLAEPVKRKLETPIRERDTTSKRGGDDRTQPPRKRLKVDKPHDTPSRHPPRPPKPALNPLKDPPTTLENPGQKISSLFTSNPVVDLPPAPEPQPLLPPSNAPLKDASTFEGLGLNTLVIKHLKDKFNINKPTAVQRASLSAILNQAPSEHRDLFIQSQTGSGKTLSFLLPIIHDLLPLSSLSYIDRSIGTLAMIIAPTRELAKQISDVLESLLQMRLSARESERTDNEETPRLTRWLISGLLVGGGTRTHEKARLRKGIPILVSTPGRLLDHLQNTESFCVAKCRWLILDEADRLMELGFHDTLAGIIKALDGRRRNAIEASKHGEGLGGEIVGGWDWGLRRRTILCSATMREDVQKLAGTALVQPLVIKGVETGTLPKPFSPTSAPEEVAWVQWVEQGMEGAEGLPSGLSALPPPEAAERSPKLIPVESDDVLTKGFGGDVGEAHRRATDVQLAFERWVLHKKSHSESAQRAFKSHMRAYATHPSGEKHIFHMRNLHIGHLAKSFALRDAPSNVKGVPKSTRHSAPKGTKVPKKDTEDKSTSGPSKAHDKVKAIPQKLSVAERMKAVMRTQGRLTKRDGQFVSATADEFQIAGADLEKLVKRAR